MWEKIRNTTVSGGELQYLSPSYYMRMAMDGYDIPLYERAYALVMEYIERYRTPRGAYAYAASILYPELYDRNPKAAVKRVYGLIVYRFRTNIFRTSRTNGFRTNGYEETWSNPEHYDMGYIVAQSRPLRHGRKTMFKRDMEEYSRNVFEFMKLVHAMTRDIYGDYYRRIKDLVNTVLHDKRIPEVIGDKRIWYNNKSYVRIDKETAALAYIVLLRIHRSAKGLAEKPKKLINTFMAYTRYTLEEIRQELVNLTPKFYDWLLLLN